MLTLLVPLNCMMSLKSGLYYRFVGFVSASLVGLCTSWQYTALCRCNEYAFQPVYVYICTLPTYISVICGHIRLDVRLHFMYISRLNVRMVYHYSLRSIVCTFLLVNIRIVRRVCWILYMCYSIVLHINIMLLRKRNCCFTILHWH